MVGAQSCRCARAHAVAFGWNQRALASARVFPGRCPPSPPLQMQQAEPRLRGKRRDTDILPLCLSLCARTARTDPPNECTAEGDIRTAFDVVSARHVPYAASTPCVAAVSNQGDNEDSERKKWASQKSGDSTEKRNLLRARGDVAGLRRTKLTSHCEFSFFLS